MNKNEILRALKIVEANGKNLNEIAWTNLETVIDRLENNY